MSDKPASKGAKPGREERLAEQLRANLMKRKQQARSRRSGAADECEPEPQAQERPAEGAEE